MLTGNPKSILTWESRGKPFNNPNKIFKKGEKMQGIYKFTNKINNKVYIGKADNLEERFKSHKRNYNNENLADYYTKFYRALRKYGFENFEYEVVESNSGWTEETLNQKEIEYISLYMATEETFGYNIQKGGNNTAVPRKLNES